MIDLLRELAALFLIWCIGLTITYGIVESILFSPVRIALSAEGPQGWWLESLVYCPICTGFWCFGLSSWAVDWAHPFSFLRGAVLGVASLLFFRELVVSNRDIEMGEIEAVRISRRKP